MNPMKLILRVKSKDNFEDENSEDDVECEETKDQYDKKGVNDNDSPMWHLGSQF